jgi:hypothetical protein
MDFGFMKKILVILILSTAAAGWSQQATNSTPPPRRDPKLDLVRTNQLAVPDSTNQLDQLRNLTPEERSQKIEELKAARAAQGTNPAPVGVSQADRVARFRHMTELMRRRNDAGQLTPAEQRRLASMEATLKRLEEHSAPPATNPPSR